MKRNSAKILFTVAAMCVVLFTTGSANAQGRRGYDNRAYTKADVEQVIRRLEDGSDRFTKSFDRALDRSRLNGTRREDRLTERAQELEEKLDSLRKEFDRRDRFQDTRTQVSDLLQTANGINTVVNRRRLDAGTERQWSALRADLNALARFYNLRALRG